ncbi:MAG: aminotransferase class I/II-fold pyridoxal phosphate-dependent enzyme, partial [Anaerolineaceae bacterium]
MAEQLADKLDWIREETQALKDAGLYRHVRTIESPQDDWFYIDGKRYLNFCSNNYLGLANHPALKEAAKDAVNRFGAGPGAVRVISGTNSLHVQLEQRIAEFKQVEDALFLTSGYNANLGTLEALVGKEDVIFSDELNHASIIDGARLSRARVVRFNHADPADLDAKIQENAGTYRRGLVVTD